MFTLTEGINVCYSSLYDTCAECDWWQARDHSLLYFLQVRQRARVRSKLLVY